MDLLALLTKQDIFTVGFATCSYLAPWQHSPLHLVQYWSGGLGLGLSHTSYTPHNFILARVAWMRNWGFVQQSLTFAKELSLKSITLSVWYLLTPCITLNNKSKYRRPLSVSTQKHPRAPYQKPPVQELKMSLRMSITWYLVGTVRIGDACWVSCDGYMAYTIKAQTCMRKFNITWSIWKAGFPSNCDLRSRSFFFQIVWNGLLLGKG